MDGTGIPRSHYPLVNEAGEVIGEVTSGTQSPSLSKGVGLGYVQICPGRPRHPNFRAGARQEPARHGGQSYPSYPARK